MHDIVDLEDRGIPGVFAATVQFEKAAQTQSRALGAEPAAVYVEHPIQDRTGDEMDAIADGALESLGAALVQAESSP